MSNDNSYIITVCICTYNRHDMLVNLLPLLDKQTLLAQQFEILIVDNSDNLQARDCFYREIKLPVNARVVYSKPPGLSRARNVGIQSCSTPYIAFIDDDAEPCAEWLQELINGFQRFESVHAVGGKIDPLWATCRPKWLPKEYEGCLTILDLGNEMRKLPPGEYIYGTNMAFRLETLKNLGAFDEALGRRGSSALLSNEEIDIINDIHRAGGAVVYNPRAIVRHKVHAQRLSQSYLKRRMAWQAVSDLIANGAGITGKSVLESLRRTLRNLNIPEYCIYNLLKNNRSPAIVSSQIEAIYRLVLYILHENDDSNVLELANLDQMIAELIKDKPIFENASYITPVPIHAETQCLFLETAPSHVYLFDLYGNLPNVQLVAKNNFLWGDRFLDNLEEFLRYSVSHITGGVASIFFLTLCPFLNPAAADILARYLRNLPVRKYGILHEFPREEEQIACFFDLCWYLDRVIMFSEFMVDDAKAKFKLENLVYLPHHPLHAWGGRVDKAAVRRIYGIPEDRVVFTFLGEARRGKGLETLMGALKFIPEAYKAKVFVNIAGKEREDYICARDLKESLESNGIAGRVDLRGNAEEAIYAVLAEAEFVNNIVLSDVAVLPYNGRNKYAMSGILPDMVHRGVPVIAPADSYVGKTVGRYGLGLTYGGNRPELLCEAMMEAIDSLGRLFTDGRHVFCEETHPQSVLRRLREILSEGDEDSVGYRGGFS